MIYFKYKTSFKKAGALADLVLKQDIIRIDDQENLIKRCAKGGNVYAFISPYFSELENENVLIWANTEEQAWDLFYNCQEDL